MALEYVLIAIASDPLEKDLAGVSLENKSPQESKGADDLVDEIISVKIADLGNACWVGHHFTNDIQTRQYRSPEVILGAKWGASTDVWSMAAMVSRSFASHQAASSNFERSLSSSPATTSSTPNPAPSTAKTTITLRRSSNCSANSPNLCLSGKWSQEIFNRKGELRNIHRLRHWALPDVLKEKYHFNAEEANKIARFLTPLLELLPEGRANAGV